MTYDKEFWATLDTYEEFAKKVEEKNMNYNKYEEFAKKNINFGKWTLHSKDYDKAIPVAPAPTDKEIIDEILQHPSLEDKGFFEDVVDWLRKDAPRKLRAFLNDLYPWTTALSKASADLSYGVLCEAVFRMGFRASERLEQRMMLGQNNEWVKKYFADFPPRSTIVC